MKNTKITKINPLVETKFMGLYDIEYKNKQNQNRNWTVASRKKKEQLELKYSKNDSFENLEVVQQMALNRKGKDDEINPDISIFLKAEELKGKLCGLYSEKEKANQNINLMGSVKINGKKLQINVGESVEIKDD